MQTLIGIKRVTPCHGVYLLLVLAEERELSLLVVPVYLIMLSCQSDVTSHSKRHKIQLQINRDLPENITRGAGFWVYASLYIYAHYFF